MNKSQRLEWLCTPIHPFSSYYLPRGLEKNLLIKAQFSCFEIHGWGYVPLPSLQCSVNLLR